MSTTFVRHYEGLRKQNLRLSPFAECHKAYKDLVIPEGEGRSTFYKHLAHLALASRKTRRPVVKTRVVYVDVDKAEQEKRAQRREQDREIERKLLRLDRMASELAASPEGKALAGEANVRQALRDAQAQTERLQQQRQQEIAEARKQAALRRW